MQNHIQTLVKQFFRKDSLEEVPVDEVKAFTEEYPYSAAGQFLYAKKLQQAGDGKEQAEKATLYFHNPVWSRWLFQKHTQQVEPLPLEKVIPKEIIAPALIDDPALEEPASEEQAPAEPETAVHNDASPVAEEVYVASPEIAAPVEKEETEVAPPAAVNHPTNDVPVHTEPSATNVPSVSPVSDTDEDPPFEPYHTIDYFASQGIKLRLEDLPKDKLGQQLKSFTDWLRSMKKINQAVTADTNTNSLDDITHQAIQQIAEHSVAGKEIITEAMAEVWAKQGHREKATAIYEKLSLLNPAKSAYFAGKIEQLKAV